MIKINKVCKFVVLEGESCLNLTLGNIININVEWQPAV